MDESASLSLSADTHAVPGGSGRRPVTVIRPSASFLRFPTHLARLPRYADLLYTLTIHRVRVRYKQSQLGLAWAVLQPLLMMLVFTVLFSFIARMPSEGLPYAAFVYAAMLPWTCFSTAVSLATASLVSHAPLVTKVFFPREILPLSYIAAALFDFGVASTLLAGLMLYYHAPLTIHAAWAIPSVALLAAFATAVSLFLSALQVRLRDVGLALPLLMQIWMFATPVVYPLSAVKGRIRAFYVLNPMVGVIDTFRRVTLQGQAPDLALLAFSALVTAILLPFCYAYFKHVEATMADVI